MTTEETIEVVEPEIVTPRDLNELLSLGTYQGMTDAEIEIIFNYRLSKALQEAEIEQLNAKTIEMSERITATNEEMARSCAESSKAILDAIANRQYKPITIVRTGELPEIKPGVVTFGGIGGDSVG